MTLEKTALVTGATTGIGRATAALLKENGYHVIGVAKNKTRLKQLERELGVATEAVDLSNLSLIKPIVSRIFKKNLRIDLLINNAGVGLFQPLTETRIKNWQSLFNLNLFSVMELTRLFLAHKPQDEPGHVINVSSVAGRRAWKNMTAYTASKHALIGFSTSLRRELRSSGRPIRVTSILPPATRTQFFVNSGYPDYEKDHSHQTLAEPGDVAQEIVSAIGSNKREIVIGKRARLLDFCYRISPGFVEKLEDIAG